MQALGALIAVPGPQPNAEITEAVLAAMQDQGLPVQMPGVIALERWGTASAIPELQELAQKSGNPGLQAQVQRIVPTLKTRTAK